MSAAAWLSFSGTADPSQLSDQVAAFQSCACARFDAAENSPAAGGVVFLAATGIDANAITQVQVRLRLLRVFLRRGLLPGDDAQAMGQWQPGGGFSVDGSVRIEASRSCAPTAVAR